MDYDKKKKNLIHQINVIMARIHYAENRRNNFVLIAVALMAAGISLITFTVNDLTQIYKLFLVVLSIFFILLSLFIWVIYSRQTNFYPFTDFTRNKKWFYRDVLEFQENFDVSFWNCLFGNKKVKKKVGDKFKKQYSFYKSYSDKFLNEESKDIEADQNQIYILHVNEKYKNLYLSHLKRITFVGIIASIILAIVVTLFCVVFANSKSAVKKIKLSELGVNYELMLRETGNVRSYNTGLKDLELLVNLSVVNKKNMDLTIDKIVLKDSFGMSLPYVINKNCDRKL